MLNLTDKELVEEITSRLDENRKNIDGQNDLMRQLISVNEKLLRSEQLKSNFLSNIRNEINNPITSVLELSKSINSNHHSIEDMKKFGELIFSEVSSLDFQLRNIFLAAELEAGEFQISVSNVNINSLITRVLDSFKRQIDKKGIQVIYTNHIEKDLGFKTDSNKLLLIVSNLISNAINFNQVDGVIYINSKIEDGIYDLSIKDNGVGISEENKSKIYDRFLQSEEGSKKTYSGHGLGLSITKTLLEMLGGSISLDSELTVGSNFKILLKSAETKQNESFYEEGNDFLFNSEEEMKF
jgi:signal transduction histidine kinase